MRLFLKSALRLNCQFSRHILNGVLVYGSGVEMDVALVDRSLRVLLVDPICGILEKGLSQKWLARLY